MKNFTYSIWLDLLCVARLLAVVAVVLAWQQGGAQVINSIGEENMKVERGMKPKPKPAENPYVADLNTETPQFQCADSAKTDTNRHDWARSSK